LCAVPNGEDFHAPGLDSITDQIRVDDNELLSLADGPAALGMLLQTIACNAESQRHALGGQGID
jgi:hypothetical protein